MNDYHNGDLAGMARNPCCMHEHKDSFYPSDLACWESFLKAEDAVATYLGDGKEADCRTNRPNNQTDPALFAAPLALCADVRSRATSFSYDLPGLQAC
jgi:hypothetical protein